MSVCTVFVRLIIHERQKLGKRGRLTLIFAMMKTEGFFFQFKRKFLIETSIKQRNKRPKIALIPIFHVRVLSCSC